MKLYLVNILENAFFLLNNILLGYITKLTILKKKKKKPRVIEKKKNKIS